MVRALRISERVSRLVFFFYLATIETYTRRQSGMGISSILSRSISYDTCWISQVLGEVEWGR
jgi:hypothetical protein